MTFFKMASACGVRFNGCSRWGLALFQPIVFPVAGKVVMNMRRKLFGHGWECLLVF